MASRYTHDVLIMASKALMRVPWTARRPNQSILKETSPGHWKDWCWGWNSNTLATSWEELTHWKRPWCWEGLRAGREGVDGGWDGWMASLTHAHEFGWTPGVGDGQGGLECCDSWGCKELDMTEPLNWIEVFWRILPLRLLEGLSFNETVWDTWPSYPCVCALVTQSCHGIEY